MAEHVINGFQFTKSSRAYLDPMESNGPVIIKKKADPKKLEAIRAELEMDRKKRAIIENRFHKVSPTKKYDNQTLKDMARLIAKG